MSKPLRCVLLLMLAVVGYPQANAQQAADLYSAARAGNAAALQKLRTLADKGDSQAQFLMGDLYSLGKGVPKDAAQAVQWYRRAAEQDYSPAELSLGLMYALGNDVPKDAIQAVAWFRKAAEKGDPTGQSHLGVMYASGDGVTKDVVTAFMWFDLAAAQGDANAKTLRDSVEEEMTQAQIDEAQKLSEAWQPRK